MSFKFAHSLSNHSSSTLFLIDFGLARYHIDEKGNLAKKKYDQRMNLGTKVFQSKNLCYGKYRACRADDLIGAFYSVVHFYLPLPWFSKSILSPDEQVQSRKQYSKASIILAYFM